MGKLRQGSPAVRSLPIRHVENHTWDGNGGRPPCRVCKEGRWCWGKAARKIRSPLLN